MINTILYNEVIKNNHAKEWVVFIHGAGGSTATWKYQIEAFKPFYNILLLDLRDHGKSKKINPDQDTYTFEVITNDIKKVLDQHEVTKAHFITLSFGSVLLQDLSIKYPDLIASAIFAGGIFKANNLIKSFVQAARFFNMFLPYSWMYSMFSYLLMPYKKHQKSRYIYRQQAKKLTPTEYMKWVGLYNEFFNLLEAFYNQRINFPALAIMGRRDYIFRKAAAEFSKNHKSVLMMDIKGAGHICNIDQSDVFNQLSLYFTHQHKYYNESDFPEFQAHNSKTG